MSDQTLENCPICKGQAGKHFGLVGCDESKCNVPQGSFTLEEWQDRTPPPAVTELVEALDTLIAVVGLTAFKHEGQRAALQEAVNSGLAVLSKYKLEGG